MFTTLSPKQARKAYPGKVIAKACGGAMVFNSKADYWTWRKQR